MDVTDVALREMCAEDAGIMAGWSSDAEFCLEAGWSLDQPLHERRQFFLRLIESPLANLVRLGVESGGVLIGYVDFHGTDPVSRELGFLIGQRGRWGLKLGLSAATAGLDYGFRKLGLGQVWAEALDANVRSIRILQKLGMTETGRGSDGLFAGTPSFFRTFLISADEWQLGRPLSKPRDADR